MVSSSESEQLMSEERFDRIDATLVNMGDRLVRVETTVVDMGGRLGRVETTVEQLVVSQARTDVRLDRLEQGQARLEVGVATLEAGQRDLRTDLNGLRTHMLVLHEEVLDTIKSTAVSFEPLRREIRAGDDAVREDIARRLDPLELTVRSHSVDLARLKKRRKA